MRVRTALLGGQKQGKHSLKSDHLPTWEWLPFVESKLKKAVNFLWTNSSKFLKAVGEVLSTV